MDKLSAVDLSDERLMMTHELLAAGYDNRAITRMVQSGALVRVRHGAYVAGTLWGELDPTPRQRFVDLAALRSAKTDVVLSHTSAVREVGCPTWDLPLRTHLARLDRRAGRHEAGKTQHRGLLGDTDVVVRRGIPMTSGTRTALDVMTTTDIEHGLVVTNGLLHAGETTKAQLEQRSASMRDHPHSSAMTRVLQLATPKCTSVFESRFWFLCWEEDLPIPELQYDVPDGHGGVLATLDFAWPQFGAFVETDGRAKYKQLLKPGETVDQVVMREKQREAKVVARTAWRPIRVIWPELDRRRRTAERVYAALMGVPVNG